MPRADTPTPVASVHVDTKARPVIEAHSVRSRRRRVKPRTGRPLTRRLRVERRSGRIVGQPEASARG